MEFQKSLIINIWFVKNKFVLYTPEQNFYLNIEKGLSEKIILFCDKNCNIFFEKEEFLKISEDKILEKIWDFFIEKWLFFERLDILSQLKNISRLFDNPAILQRTDEDEELSYNFLEKNKEKFENKKFNFLDLTRKSFRDFSWEKVNLEIIEKIIYDSYFFEKNLYRACPSGGAFYPLKFFYIENNSNSFYEYKNLKFEKIWFINFDEIFYLYNDFEKSSWILLIMADLSISSIKYWYKSLKLAYLEAWHFAQNFYLVSEKIEKLWICEFAGVNEQLIYKEEKLKNFLFCSSIIIWKT